MTVEVRIGDSRKLIHGLADKSIDCCVTSPPYWSLRDYKTDPIIFDGLPDCEHEWIIEKGVKNIGRDDKYYGGSVGASEWGIEKKSPRDTDFCSLCGAWRGQLGLEPTPELFIKHLLDFFDDVKLKLKDEGNCFVNLGDTYSANRGYQVDGTKQTAGSQAPIKISSQSCGVPPKCLCFIPERFAIGMIERGWIVRNKIIWSKPNHIPESVTDRLTKTHEVIYHFVKQQKYYYNLDAIREPNKVCGVTDKRPLGIERSRDYEGKWQGNKMSENFGSPRARTQRKHDNTNHAGNGSGVKDHSGYFKADGTLLINPLGKNPGDVWNITTQPFAGSHFAVFPLELVRRPILAGCPEQVCAICGKPKGWCSCLWRFMLDDPFINGTVLDPFAGSGTVGEFCRHNDRNAILFELNPEYKKLIDDRAMLNIPELSSFAEAMP